MRSATSDRLKATASAKGCATTGTNGASASGVAPCRLLLGGASPLLSKNRGCCCAKGGLGAGDLKAPSPAAAGGGGGAPACAAPAAVPMAVFRNSAPERSGSARLGPSTSCGGSILKPVDAVRLP